MEFVKLWGSGVHLIWMSINILNCRKHFFGYAVRCWFLLGGVYWQVTSQRILSYSKVIHPQISVTCSTSQTSYVLILIPESWFCMSAFSFTRVTSFQTDFIVLIFVLCAPVNQLAVIEVRHIRTFLLEICLTWHFVNSCKLLSGGMRTKCVWFR